MMLLVAGAAVGLAITGARSSLAEATTWFAAEIRRRSTFYPTLIT